MKMLLKLAAEKPKESGRLDFKAEFDPHDHGACCEVIKDIVAMANSGGGVLAIGVNDDGTRSGADLSALLRFDVANLTGKLNSFTGSNFADIEIHAVSRYDGEIVALCVGPSESPLAFSKDGSYRDAAKGNISKFAFRAGSTYFRHGAKSAPGTTEDLKDFLHRQLKAARKEFLRNVTVAASAGLGSTVRVVSREESERLRSEPIAVRVVTDPEAPTVGLIDNEARFPLRQKELVKLVRKLLPKGTDFTTHDVQAIRRVHSIDSAGDYSHFFGFGVRRYAGAFAVWIVQQWKADHSFLSKTRAAYKLILRKNGKGPWTRAKKRNG